jgi:hypothetical protein
VKGACISSCKSSGEGISHVKSSLSLASDPRALVSSGVKGRAQVRGACVYHVKIFSL